MISRHNHRKFKNFNKNEENQGFSTLNSFKLHKSTAEALFFDNASAVFVRLRLNEKALKKYQILKMLHYNKSRAIFTISQACDMDLSLCIYFSVLANRSYIEKIAAFFKKNIKLLLEFSFIDVAYGYAVDPFLVKRKER